jgi:hypothetical protein
MIRSQSGKKPAEAVLHATDPLNHSQTRAAPSGRIESPHYAYMMAMSGHEQELEPVDSDAVAYYLGLAENAKRKRSWASVELYYRLAWKNLPAKRREAALQALVDARSANKTSPDDSKIGLKSSAPKANRSNPKR